MAAVLGCPNLAQSATPDIDNTNGATHLKSTRANLNGALVSNGGLQTEVFVFWGETDGGTTFSNWDNAASLGVAEIGPLSMAVADLIPNQSYSYRFYANNSDGDAWASSPTNFVAPPWDGPRTPTGFTILDTSGITSIGEIIDGDVDLRPTTSAEKTSIISATTEGWLIAGGTAVTCNESKPQLPATPLMPTFTDVSTTTINLTLNINTTPHVQLILEASSDLINWRTLDSATPDTPVHTFSLPIAELQKKRFYRVYLNDQ